MANPNLMNEKEIIDVVKYRKLWFILISHEAADK